MRFNLKKVRGVGNMQRIRLKFFCFCIVFIFTITRGYAQTIALWLFDEPPGLYPSHALDDAAENDYVLVIGSGGQIVPGKFGNALAALARPPIKLPAGEADFGLRPTAISPGRHVQPMDWTNADFCALMTGGENHLRKEVGFANATHTKLNLGNFDWTVEYWYKPLGGGGKTGCVFEIGSGPRAENNQITRLILSENHPGFIFENQPAKTIQAIKSDQQALTDDSGAWHHLAFVYHAARQTLMHFLDGRLQDSIE
jgi:hypothetical protein